jgi:hypothetical protein
MKNLKNIITAVTLVLAMFMASNVNGQTKDTFSKNVDLSEMGTNSTAILSIKNGESSVVDFKVQNSEDGTSFMPSFDDKRYKKIRVDFLKDGKVISSYVDDVNSNRGPLVTDDFNSLETHAILLNSEMMSEDKPWPILVAAVVLCCVEVEYKYSTATGHSVGVRWDCDCLSGLFKSASKSIPVYVNGKKLIVDEITFTPIYSEKSETGKLPFPIKNLSIELIN